MYDLALALGLKRLLAVSCQTCAIVGHDAFTLLCQQVCHTFGAQARVFE